MKSFGVLAILFILLLAFPTKAETPFVIESAWVVANNEWLIDNPFTGEADLKFPEEIPANAAWAGATVTDGNIIGTIIVLAVSTGGNNWSDAQWDTFRLKLELNTIIAETFPNGFQMAQTETDLHLVSTELLEANVGELNMQSFLEDMQNSWEDLLAKTHFGFIQYYPERTLLPILPPEQEGESEFVKKVRKRAADNYKDGQYIGIIDSTCWGLAFSNDEYEVVWEQRNIENMPSDDTKSQPFNFGGFINTDALFNTVFRVPFDKEYIEKTFFTSRIGMTVTPPEARNNEEVTFSFQASFALAGIEIEGEGYHMLTKESNIAVFYPKQRENRPAEEGIPCNAEMDRINVELAYNSFSFLKNIRESILSLDWSQPIDAAGSYEDDVAYLAFAYSSAETYPDWNLATQLAQSIFDYMQQVKPADLPPGWHVLTETREIPITIAGLTGSRMNYWLIDMGLAIVYVHEPGFFYVAVRYLEDYSDEDTEEQYEAMQRRLEEKIEASRQAVAEKMPPPLTVLRSNRDGTKLRVNYEAIERGHRVTAYIAQDSFGNVLALAQMFGLNPLPMLQFWQTQ